MCCFANPLMRWDEYRYFYNTVKFIFAMMNEQTFNQTGTGGLLLPKALTFSLKSPQRHVLRKIQLRIWDFFSLLPLWQLLCSKRFIICVFPMKKSKVALEAQKNNPCHDFHILYGLAELFFDMPHFSYALGQFSCFFGDCTWHPQISQLSDYPPFLIRIIVWHHLGTGSSDSSPCANLHLFENVVYNENGVT